MLVSGLFFAYAFPVKRSWPFLRQRSRQQLHLRIILHAMTIFTALNSAVLSDSPRQKASDAAPAVTKVEPPNWWTGLTPEVMLLLSGHDLEATNVSCNLSTLRVSRTQATSGGNYLFVWLKIGGDTKSGTAGCRVNTPKRTTSFELPLAARPPTLGKFQGRSQDDGI